MSPGNRRREVVDAAVRVLGEQGSRGLTHRATDLAAGLPVGTTSNHFRTRDALLEGVLAHLAATDAMVSGERRIDLTSLSRQELTAVLVEQFTYLAGPARTQTLA